MSGFSPSWLALREPADHRSRNKDLAEALKTRFLQREKIAVVDLGCGTGSNLRATSQLLPALQHWTLVDHDPALLDAAKAALTVWADRCETSPKGLKLTKGATTIHASFQQADLATDLDAVLDAVAKPGPDLVTASALFDLASAKFIQTFAAAIAKRRAVFYAVLTYNGIQRWTPRSPADQPMTAAFHRHQMTDKGLGLASGPVAPVELAEAFQTFGYSVAEGDSPWRLAAADAALVAELATGFASAVGETKALTPLEIAAWLARTKTGSEVGHTDTLATPGLGAGMDGDGDD